MRRHTFTSIAAFGISALLAVVALPGTSQAADDVAGNPYGWGWDYEGATGTGDPRNEIAKPLPVPGLTDVTAISAGGYFSLELVADGTVWAHGANDWGELGDGTTHERLTPIQVDGLDDVVAISAGGSHSLAVRANGRVWAWGQNEFGQLGDGTTVDRHTPVKVHGLKNVVAVSASPDHSLALKENGRVEAWGNNSHGELGDGTTVQRLVPGKVPGLRDVTALSTGGDYNDIPLTFSFAIRTDGSLWAWGGNENGYLGDGSTIDRYVPTEVTGLHDVVGVSGGGFHALAVQADGTVWAWGADTHSQLGDGVQGGNQSTPQQVPGLTDMVGVSAGYRHSLALGADGTALGWGDNVFGQTGIGDLKVPRVLTPTDVLGLTGITSIDAGTEHSMAIAAAAG